MTSEKLVNKENSKRAIYEYPWKGELDNNSWEIGSMEMREEGSIEMGEGGKKRRESESIREWGVWNGRRIEKEDQESGTLIEGAIMTLARNLELGKSSGIPKNNPK